MKYNITHLLAFAALFQLQWLACVIFEHRFALLIFAFTIAIYLLVNGRQFKSWLLAGLIAGTGLLTDFLLSHLQIIDLGKPHLPMWLVMLRYAVAWAILIPVFCKFKQALLFVCLLLPMLLPMAGFADSEAAMQIRGDAIDPQNGKFLYREQHTINSDYHHVTYADATGKVFAEKSLHYSDGFSTPEFELIDFRFQRRYGSTFMKNQWQLWVEESNRTRTTKLISAQKNLVIDAGFNAWILEHFAELQKQQTLNFEFAITNPPDSFSMRIVHETCSPAQLAVLPADSLCFVVEPTSALLRLLVPPINLAYRIHDPALLQYEGPSNLVSDRDSSQLVRIRYYYQPASTQQAFHPPITQEAHP